MVVVMVVGGVLLVVCRYADPRRTGKPLAGLGQAA
jgi:hypothetical protein